MAKTKPGPTRESFIQRLAVATPEDLAEVDERIDALELELEGLKAARRVLDVRLNGKKKRVQRKAKGEGGGMPDRTNQAAGVRLHHLKKKIAKHLDAVGAQKPAIIAADLGVEPNEVIQALADPDMFERAGGDGMFRVSK